MERDSDPPAQIPVSDVKPGAHASFERTFTLAEVEEFGAISGDLGIHHVRPDADGRVMVQGLLVAAIPTRVGGRMNFLARELSFEFLRPVFTGDTVRCDSTVVGVQPDRERLNVEVEFTCTNQDGVTVMRGKGRGVIRVPATNPR